MKQRKNLIENVIQELSLVANLKNTSIRQIDWEKILQTDQSS